jgi:hypothetical protein
MEKDPASPRPLPGPPLRATLQSWQRHVRRVNDAGGDGGFTICAVALMAEWALCGYCPGAARSSEVRNLSCGACVGTATVVLEFWFFKAQRVWARTRPRRARRQSSCSISSEVHDVLGALNTARHGKIGETPSRCVPRGQIHSLVEWSSPQNVSVDLLLFAQQGEAGRRPGGGRHSPLTTPSPAW